MGATESPTGHAEVRGPENAATQGKRPRSTPERNLPLWKKLAFSATATLAVLLLLEGLLGMAGVRPVLYQEDPYVGFSSQIPLFEHELDENGTKVMATAANKLRWFNAQSFPPRKPEGAYRIFCLGGSTTYGRPYDDTTSFCGWLREFLPRADNTKKWELINAGGISYASYRVAKLTEELIQYEPDLFIVYSGQNEFLESRTYEHLIGTPPAVRELGALVSHTRIYATMQRAWRQVAGQSSQSAPKAAVLNAEVTTILDQSVGPKDYYRDDTFQQQVLDHYRYNLTRIVDIARSAGTEVVFVTPASNLLGCSPFKSEHRDDLTDNGLQQWTELDQSARAAIDSLRWNEALEFLNRAIAIDDRYAHSHYFRGKALYHLGRYPEAADALIRSRDEDICPLRALSEMRDIVIQVGADCHVPVVDFVSMAESVSPHGIPGKNLFLDHVHPTIEGNRLLALELLDAMVKSGHVSPGTAWNATAIADTTAEVEGRLDQRAHATALRNLSKVLAWAGRFEEARKLAETAASMIPDDATVHFQMGVCAQGEGELAEAAEHYRKAIKIEGSYGAAYNNLGHVLELQDQPQEAMDCYARAVMINGDDDKALFNMGKGLLKRGQYESAVEHFERVIKLRPLDAEAHVALASALVRIERSNEAVEELEEAAELKPRDPDIHNKLGSLYAAGGRYAHARESYARALELAPEHIGSMENSAWLLATAPDAQFRDGQKAVNLAKEACEIARYEDPATIEVLAAAQAEAGYFDLASATARRAQMLAIEQGRNGLAAAISQRLKLYESGQPFRE